jgi:hypothetical protein
MSLPGRLLPLADESYLSVKKLYSGSLTEIAPTSGSGRTATLTGIFSGYGIVQKFLPDVGVTSNESPDTLGKNRREYPDHPLCRSCAWDSGDLKRLAGMLRVQSKQLVGRGLA